MISFTKISNKPILIGIAWILFSLVSWSLVVSAALTLSDNHLVSSAAGTIWAIVLLLGYRKYTLNNFKPRQPLEQASKPLFWMTLIWGAILAFITGQAFAGWAFINFGSPMWEENLSIQNTINPIALLLISIIISPLAEEIIFRGIIYDWLRSQLPAWAGAIITTSLFSFMHLNLVQTLVVIPISLILCSAYEASRRVWVTWVLHMGFNAAALIPASLLTSFMDLGPALILLGFFIITLISINALFGKESYQIWPIKGIIAPTKTVNDYLNDLDKKKSF